MARPLEFLGQRLESLLEKPLPVLVTLLLMVGQEAGQLGMIEQCEKDE